MSGNRNLPLGHGAVGMLYSSATPKTVTLYKASYYKGSRILFSADVAAMTITPDGTETIDGATGNLVLASGNSVMLYSNGSEWFRVSG